MPPRKGRPTKISDEISQKIAMTIRGGNYAETAAAYAGISRDTFYTWLKRGARERDRLSKPRTLPDQHELQFAMFHKMVEDAMATAEVRDVMLIGKAAAGGGEMKEVKEVVDPQGNVIERTVTTKTIAPQWQAAAWRLERKYPNRWGRVASAPDAGAPEENAKEIAKMVRAMMDTVPSDPGPETAPVAQTSETSSQNPKVN